MVQPSATVPGPAISTSLTQREANALAELAAGKEVLEIGSAFGYSAVVMALAGASVYAVDPHTWIAQSHAVMLENVAAYGVLDRVTILAQYSFTALPELVSSGREFDVVWVDGDHEAPTVAHDVTMALKLLKPDGILLCHDYDEATCPGVKISLDAWKVPTTVIDTLAVYRPDQWRD
jgi:predicted O-methyltransferase YrrM